MEALRETMQGLGRSDNALLQLAEDKAALQQHLRDAQAAAQQARGEVERQGQAIWELEEANAALHGELADARERHQTAHGAVEGAAGQLQQLTDSHAALEAQLERASGTPVAEALAQRAAYTTCPADTQPL